MTIKKNISAREAAYMAVVGALRGDSYAADSLHSWRQRNCPLATDARLAQQIAYGSIRMALALDFYAKQLSHRSPGALKISERSLLYCALYQCVYLHRVPLYAIANEGVALAKKYSNRFFASYLNALIRRTAETPIDLPLGSDPRALSVRYSYPLWFVETLIAAYGVTLSEALLSHSNKSGLTMARWRPKEPPPYLPRGIRWFSADPCGMASVEGYALHSVAASTDWYIQNGTTALLIQALHRRIWQPRAIVDLCAAPGGKLLMVHDLYPQASLWANDFTREKVAILEENCNKYGLSVQRSWGPAELFSSPVPFDLIILDVPCSNSGVLSKRVEARWRLSHTSIQEHLMLQRKLVEHACTLLAPHGEIWYLTCSILPEENELLTNSLCQQLFLEKRIEKIILPDENGYDGGYGCALRPSCSPTTSLQA